MFIWLGLLHGNLCCCAVFHKQTTAFCDISGFRLGVVETFAFLRFYAA